MEFTDTFPPVCQTCEERKNCLAKGEGEWCCEECDYLALRFVRLDILP